MTRHGRFLARVSGPVNRNVLLRTRQYQLVTEPQSALSIAKMLSFIYTLLGSEIYSALKSVGLDPAVALLLARYIRGDLDTYPPFMWKLRERVLVIFILITYDINVEDCGGTKRLRRNGVECGIQVYEPLIL